MEAKIFYWEPVDTLLSLKWKDVLLFSPPSKQMNNTHKTQLSSSNYLFALSFSSSSIKSSTQLLVLEKETQFKCSSCDYFTELADWNYMNITISLDFSTYDKYPGIFLKCCLCKHGVMSCNLWWQFFHFMPCITTSSILKTSVHLHLWMAVKILSRKS